MVIIKLSFNKLERNKKMRLQFIESENNEFIEDEEVKGKYCKEKLNKILEYEKKILWILKKNLNQIVVIIVQIFLMVIIILIFLLF